MFIQSCTLQNLYLKEGLPLLATGRKDFAFGYLSMVIVWETWCIHKSSSSSSSSIPNFATEKEQKRNFLDFNDVTLVVVDINSERFMKNYMFTAGLVWYDHMVTIMFDTKTSESESFIDRLIEGIINIMMEFHHF